MKKPYFQIALLILLAIGTPIYCQHFIAVDQGEQLIRAIWKKDAAAVHKLVEQGAPVNYESEFGSTPLNEAASDGDLELVTYLLAHGADPDFRNEDGKRAIDFTTDPRIRRRLSRN